MGKPPDYATTQPATKMSAVQRFLNGGGSARVSSGPVGLGTYGVLSCVAHGFSWARLRIPVIVTANPGSSALLVQRDGRFWRGMFLPSCGGEHARAEKAVIGSSIH